MKTLLIQSLVATLLSWALFPTEARTALGTYRAYCSACHGVDLKGGLGPSLIDTQWLHGDSDAAIEEVIRTGSSTNGMPGFGSILSDKEIRGLIIYLREEADYANDNLTAGQEQHGIFQTKLHSFKLVELAQFEGIAWALAQLPDQSLLITIREGELWRLTPQGQKQQIKGLPRIWRRGQGGLLDVALHPKFEQTGWVYISYSESKDRLSGMTAIARGKIDQGRWQQNQTLFSTDSKVHTYSGEHFGSRILFKEDHLYFTIGDRGYKERAQSLDYPNGKVHRLTLDGKVPSTNPYPKAKYPSIWSYGHRNPQGITLNPTTGEIWSVEHGPRGGDELNLIRQGLNYGWPEITHGMNYSGTPITAYTAKEGMEQPEVFWVPSLAVSAVHFYQGEMFSNWQGHLLVASLKAQQLRLLELKGGKVQSQEILLRDQDRIRDVIEGQDGAIYLALEDRATDSSRIVRLEPALDH